jgi:hypothetical protein
MKVQDKHLPVTHDPRIECVAAIEYLDESVDIAIFMEIPECSQLAVYL